MTEAPRALPRALGPWARELSLFPEEVAVALAGMASRLAGILGAGEGAASPSGSVDGYDGIDRRGPYDRLLATEWLLHDELPDEFMRRVVAGEHSFLAPAYQQQPAIRRTVVLFDAGIDQLGAPRLVHLALLVLMATRAEQRRSSFVWGIQQDVTQTLHEGLTHKNVRELLKARQLGRARDADVHAWTTSLTTTPMSELWLVGPRSLRAHADRLKASYVGVEELLEPDGPPRLSVEARAAGKTNAVRTATLDLPAPQLSVQMLRDPFAVAAVRAHLSRVAIDPTSTLVFGADGRRLYVRGLAGRLLTYRIPNSAHVQMGPPAVFTPPKGERVVAVGQLPQGRQTVVVTSTADGVVLHTLSKRGSQSASAVLHDVPGGYFAPSLPELFPLAVFDATHAAYVDGDRRLVGLEPFVPAEGYEPSDSAGMLVLRDGTDILLSSAQRDRLAYLQRISPSKLLVGALKKSEAPNPREVDLAGADESACKFFFSRVVTSTDARKGLVHGARSDAGWSIFRTGPRATIACPGDYTLVGAVEMVKGSGVPLLESLVVVDPTRTRLELRDIKETETLCTTTSPIAQAAVSDNGNVIALVTLAGELCIYSCSVSAVVYRGTSGAAK